MPRLLAAEGRDSAEEQGDPLRKEKLAGGEGGLNLLPPSLHLRMQDVLCQHGSISRGGAEERTELTVVLL